MEFYVTARLAQLLRFVTQLKRKDARLIRGRFIRPMGAGQGTVPYLVAPNQTQRNCPPVSFTSLCPAIYKKNLSENTFHV